MTLGQNPGTLWRLIGLLFPQTQAFVLADGRSMDKIMQADRIQPARRDGPLRAVDVSDDEVREMQAVALQVQPDSILNISGVVTGCPCEDGPACSVGK
jgi:hypothetical protein